MPGTFSPPPWVSDPDMHHGTCVTHVPWCMSGSLTSGFLWSWLRGKRSRHSQRLCNPQFYVSGKRPMVVTEITKLCLCGGKYVFWLGVVCFKCCKLNCWIKMSYNRVTYQSMSFIWLGWHCYSALIIFIECTWRFNGYHLLSQFRLAARHGISPYDNRYQWWDEFPLDNIVSNSVTIEVVSIYALLHNGFVEVEFYTGQSE